jgi:uncharacterized protein (DUF2147 family)
MKMLRSKSLKTARSWTVKLRPLARYTEDGQKKTDIHNPDPVKRERPLIGLVVMKGVSLNGPHKWDGGTAYDPKTGNTYSVSLEYDGGNTLKVRGYLPVSGIGRTEVLTRAE